MSILQKIVSDKKLWLKAQNNITKPCAYSGIDFYSALKSVKPAFILECKKASPSLGEINKNFDIAKIAKIYSKYASMISVLCDEKYFKGSFADLKTVSQVTNLPLLCKDFILDPHQIYLARSSGACGILLMLSILDDKQYTELSNLAHNLNMGVLTEISNEEELFRAKKLKARAIGINNRNLRDMSIDIKRTLNLVPKVKNQIKNAIIVSESGFHNHAQIAKISPFVNGFLIGSSLMKALNLETKIKKLLYGENKICGLTRKEDALVAYENGAVYGGLIFVNSSPRFVQNADEITKAAPLLYVGVFMNEKISTILTHAKNLSVIQLHGDENQDYINQLRSKLDPKIQIWKALKVHTELPKRDLKHIDRYVLDSPNPGSGNKFNWDLLINENLENVILAGGLDPINCKDALKLGAVGLDFNSGLEVKAGIKDKSKIQRAFAIIKGEL